MSNKENAALTVAAIRHFAENPEALENFESYLSQHYDIWLTKYANTPDGLTAELSHFAHIRED